MKALKSIVLTAALLAGSTTAGWSEMFKIAHQFAATHYLWEHGVKVFAEEATALSDGKITFEVFPGGQLGKDYYALLQSNVADMALIPVSSISAEKFPMSSVLELPGFYGSSCEAVAKFWTMAKPDGFLGTEEYTSQNLHMLTMIGLAPYAIMTSNKEVKTMEDLRGLKIRGNGAAQENMLTLLGAVPVKVGSTEVYDAVSRGTIDGALYPWSGVQQYSLERVLHHAVIGPQLGTAATAFAMSKSRWDGLSDETKEIFEKAAAKARKNLCEWFDNTDLEIQDAVSKAGMNLYKLPEEEIERWHTTIAPVAESWVKQMDASGVKGTEALEAFKAAE